MLSLQFIREHTDVVRKSLADRQTASGDAAIDEILRLDERRRALLAEVEALRAEQNAAGKQIGAAKDPVERQRMIDAMKGVSTRVDDLTPILGAIEGTLDGLLMEIPNIPDAATPYGESEDANRVAIKAKLDVRQTQTVIGFAIAQVALQSAPVHDRGFFVFGLFVELIPVFHKTHSLRLGVPVAGCGQYGDGQHEQELTGHHICIHLGCTPLVHHTRRGGAMFRNSRTGTG